MNRHVTFLVVTAVIMLPSRSVPQDPFVTTHLSPHVRLFDGGGRHAVLIERGDHRVLVDTKAGAAGQALATAVLQPDRKQRIPLTHLVLTSTGGSEASGLAALARAFKTDSGRPERPVLVTSDKSWQRLVSDRSAGEGTDLPTSWTFDRTLTLNAGGQTLRLLAVGPATTDGDLVVYLPEEKILITGNLVVAGRHPNHAPALGGSLRGWLASLQRMHTLYGSTPGLRVVPGHGRIGGSELLTRQIEYLDQILNFVGDAFERGLTLEDMESAAQPLRDKHASLAGGDHFGALLRAAYREIARG